MKAKKVHVVVTTVNDGERDLFSDVVLITKDKKKADLLVERLQKHEKIRKYDWLSEYDDAASFERTIDKELK